MANVNLYPWTNYGAYNWDWILAELQKMASVSGEAADLLANINAIIARQDEAIQQNREDLENKLDGSIAEQDQRINRAIENQNQAITDKTTELEQHISDELSYVTGLTVEVTILPAGSAAYIHQTEIEGHLHWEIGLPQMDDAASLGGVPAADYALKSDLADYATKSQLSGLLSKSDLALRQVWSGTAATNAEIELSEPLTNGLLAIARVYNRYVIFAPAQGGTVHTATYTISGQVGGVMTIGNLILTSESTTSTNYTVTSSVSQDISTGADAPVTAQSPRNLQTLWILKPSATSVSPDGGGVSPDGGDVE